MNNDTIISQKKSLHMRVSHILIALCLAVMAGLIVFALIYTLIYVPIEKIPLATGIHRSADAQEVELTIRTGSLQTILSSSSVTLSMLKRVMYGCILRAEALLLTILGILACYSRMTESIRICGAFSPYAARQVVYIGVVLLAGSILYSLAAAYAEYLYISTFFAESLEKAGTNLAYHASFPVSGWIGGLLLVGIGITLGMLIKEPQTDAIVDIAKKE